MANNKTIILPNNPNTPCNGCDPGVSVIDIVECGNMDAVTSNAVCEYVQNEITNIPPPICPIPLKVIPTGQFKPVLQIVDKLPTENNSVGDRYATIFEIPKAGLLYDYNDIMNVNFNDGWQVPSNDDWNNLLNTLESNPNARNHGEKAPSGWRGNIAGRKLKAVCFNGTDDYNYHVIPANYINSDGSTLTGNDDARYWTSTQVKDKLDVHSKRFNRNTGRVWAEPIASSSKNSIRLINKSLVTSDTSANINGFIYNVKQMPDGYLWMTSNLADLSIPNSIPNNDEVVVSSPCSDPTYNNKVIVCAEWTGSGWIYEQMGEGFSVVVIEDEHSEYRVINGVLVKIICDVEVPLAATEMPLPCSEDGAVGISAKYAREDHIHPCILPFFEVEITDEDGVVTTLKSFGEVIYGYGCLIQIWGKSTFWYYI